MALLLPLENRTCVRYTICVALAIYSSRRVLTLSINLRGDAEHQKKIEGEGKVKGRKRRI